MLQFNFDINSIGWHPPTYVKFIILLNIVILIWIISALIVTFHEYVRVNLFFKRFRNRLIDSKSDKIITQFIADYLQKNKYIVFGCILSALLEFLRFKHDPQNKVSRLLNKHMEVQHLQGKIVQRLSLKINRLLFLCIISIFSAIFVFFVEIYKILQYIYSEKYSLKIGFVSLGDSVFPVVIICMIIIFFSTLTYLISKRFIYLASLKIEDSLSILSQNDYESGQEILENPRTVKQSE